MVSGIIQYGHLNLPPECMNILKEVKRPAIKALYAFKWKRFAVWCLNNNCDPKTVIIPYLLHLA